MPLLSNETIQEWKLVLGDGDAEKAEKDSLKRCKAFIHRLEWGKASIHYKVYNRLCSFHEDLELGLFTMIRLGLAKQNVSDQHLVADTFCLTRTLLSKDSSTICDSTIRQCISMLYELLEMRIKWLLPSTKVVDEDFFVDLASTEAPFMVQLEITFLWNCFMTAASQW